MSQVRSLPSTFREKSTWTPKNYPPSNEKIFQERMGLIKKWYAAWNESQRWTLLEYILRQQSDENLTVIHDLLHTVSPLPDHDFTSVLPRHLCLRVFSLLDPQSLCRAAQVSWYWKYLAESNELWQRKCLRLGWFLPSPPCTYDSTVWKRHYISCVCQLHWNPPQPPPEETSMEELDRSDEIDGETNNKTKVKKMKIPRQPHSDGPKKPWKDPDKYPKDIHYLFSNYWCAEPLNTSLNLTSSCSVSPSAIKASKARVVAQEPAPPFLPPPSSLLHPTLLEKMRLGSPSSAHIHLSTINRAQSNQSISETFYGLQDSAPFPRLPPYYVHKPANQSANRTTDGCREGVGGAAGTGNAKPRPASAARPPSGRSNASVSFPVRSNVSPQKANRTREQLHTKQSSQTQLQAKDSAKHNTASNLLSRAWTLPQEEEDG